MEEQQKFKDQRKQKLAEAKKRVAAEERKKQEDKKFKESHRKDVDKLRKEEGEISLSEKEQRHLLHGSGVLLQETDYTLSESIKAGNIDHISVAYGLLEVERKRMDSTTIELAKLASKRKNLSL